MVWGYLVGFAIVYGLIKIFDYADRRFAEKRATEFKGLVLDKEYKRGIFHKDCVLTVKNLETNDKLRIYYGEGICKTNPKDLYSRLNIGDSIEIKAAKNSEKEFLGLEAKVI